jgi:flagellar protein FlaG
MGFSVTGSHVVFFIASVIAAGAVSGVFMAAAFNINTSLTEKSQRVQEELDSEYTIINDPELIPNTNGYYIFYLKNLGGKKLISTNQTLQLFIDGIIIQDTSYYFSDTSVLSGDVVSLYVDESVIDTGNHKLRVVGPQAVQDDFIFTIE